MALHGPTDEPDAKNALIGRQRLDRSDPLDSGLRRKFLAFCEENPSADECRIYEV